MDISTLLGTLATEATKIVQNGEDEWYAASKDLEDFKDLKAKMEEKKVWWVEAIRRNGLAQEEIVREPLASAVKCLQEESKKLEELQNNGCLSFIYKASHAFQIPCLSIHVQSTCVSDLFEKLHGQSGSRVRKNSYRN
jgi:hypothetical protein